MGSRKKNVRIWGVRAEVLLSLTYEMHVQVEDFLSRLRSVIDYYPARSVRHRGGGGGEPNDEG